MPLPDQIAPSILSADFARLGAEVDEIIKAGADMIHFDVMDYHYVPNLTVGPLVCKALRSYGVAVPVDVHLMVTPVDGLIKDFAKAGASSITFHPEATPHVDRSLQMTRDLGCRNGLALNPATPLSVLDHVLDKIDMVLLMSVNPGFGGQSFIPQTLEKIRQTRARLDSCDLPVRLMVDGGIKADNIAAVKKAGADTFVCGSAVFDSDDYSATLSILRTELARA